MSEFIVTETGLVLEETRIQETSQWGSGSQQFSIDKKQGIFCGADNYADAPLKISWLGVLTAVDLIATGGTITGATIQTATSGYRIKVNGTTGKIEFLNNDTVLTSMYADASNNMVLASDGLIKFDLGTDSQTWYMSSSGFYPLTDKTGNLGSSSKEWSNVYSRDYYSSGSKGMDLSFTFDAGESHSFVFVSGLLISHSKHSEE